MGRIAGVVLAGGLSTRLGRDKASTPLGGRPMLQWVVEALANAGCGPLVVVRAATRPLPQIETTEPLLEVVDEYDELGPLAAMATAFPRVEAELCFVASCDVPLLRPALVGALAALAEGYDVVVPVVESHLQPLTAVYRPAACGPVFRAAVERRALKVVATYASLRVREVAEQEYRDADPGLVSFHNANSEEDLRAIEVIVAGEGHAPGVG